MTSRAGRRPRSRPAAYGKPHAAPARRGASASIKHGHDLGDLLLEMMNYIAM
ncbi:hypothetical protein QJS66_14200 [Kocuria rhizophila]|nr:hypothetical protein QJS66_14200 [Kocuria rhizophila]